MSTNKDKHGVTSWDEDALAGEVCCKETADRAWYDDIADVPTCGKPAAKCIVSDDGERLPFCAFHWSKK